MAIQIMTRDVRQTVIRCDCGWVHTSAALSAKEATAVADDHAAECDRQDAPPTIVDEPSAKDRVAALEVQMADQKARVDAVHDPLASEDARKVADAVRGAT